MVEKNGMSDGRRRNRPPEHGKIRRGEVRNPWGKRGKPAPSPPSTMDDILWEEASRVVGHDENGPIDVKRRLVQEDIVAALKHKDTAARARLLASLRQTSDRLNSERLSQLEWLLGRKAALKEQFDHAERQRLPAPDIVPHPDHLVIDTHGNCEITGPIDRKSRALWEHRKAILHVISCNHAIERAEYRRTGDPTVLAQLMRTEKERRRIMRTVPKGWNWREEIYCCDSHLEEVKELTARRQQIGYIQQSDTT